jgi:hypothetical protein
MPGVHLSGPALSGAVPTDAQIEVIERLPSECWPASLLRPAADGGPGIYPQMRLVAALPGSRHASANRESSRHEMQS